MNPNRFKQLQLQLPSLNSILFFVLLAWLLGTVGLGWLFKSLLVVLVILAVLPIVAVFVVQWWVKRKLVEGACPSCGFDMMGVDGMALQCPNCGEQLQVSGGQFQRYAEPGTIDVDVVDRGVDVVDVTVLPPEDDHR